MDQTKKAAALRAGILLATLVGLAVTALMVRGLPGSASRIYPAINIGICVVALLLAHSIHMAESKRGISGPLARRAHQGVVLMLLVGCVGNLIWVVLG